MVEENILRGHILKRISWSLIFFVLILMDSSICFRVNHEMGVMQLKHN